MGSHSRSGQVREYKCEGCGKQMIRSQVCIVNIGFVKAKDRLMVTCVDCWDALDLARVLEEAAGDEPANEAANIAWTMGNL